VKTLGSLNEEAVHGSVSRSEICETISALFPRIRTRWHRPLLHHARYAYADPEGEQRDPIRQDARRRLLRMVETAAVRAGYTPDAAIEARKQLAAVPVLQTGPHCLLIVDADAFYTHHFSLLGLREKRLRWHHWYGCSTVKLIERAHKGPGWLRVDGGTVNLFDLSRRRMNDLSVCGIRDDQVRFRLAAAPGTNSEAAGIRALARMLPDRSFVSAAEAIRTANVDLWKHCMGGGDSHLLQLDDFDMADLVADHLDDPHSWLATNLFDMGGFGETILKCLMYLDVGPWQGWIRRTTDLFWGLSDGRLVPLRLADGTLRSVCGIVKCDFDRRSLAAALIDRTVVPSLLMTFIVLSILPGVRVLGGFRQIVYYPLMRHVIGAALDLCGYHALRADIENDRSPGIWGHRVLKPADGDPLAEIRESGIGDRLAAFGALPLQTACGDLASFTGDPLWATLGRNLAAGAISSFSPELRGDLT
jgi:hypothetical protein